MAIISRRSRGLELFKEDEEKVSRYLLFEAPYIPDPEDPGDNYLSGYEVLSIQNDGEGALKLFQIVDFINPFYAITALVFQGWYAPVYNEQTEGASTPVIDQEEVEGGLARGNNLSYEEIDYCATIEKTLSVCLLQSFDVNIDMQFVSDLRYQYAVNLYSGTTGWFYVEYGEWQDNSTKTEKGYSLLIYSSQGLAGEMELETLDDISSPAKIAASNKYIVLLDPGATKKVKVFSLSADPFSCEFENEFGEIRTVWNDAETPQIEYFENPVSVTFDGSSIFILDEWYDVTAAATKYFIKKYDLSGNFINRIQIPNPGKDIYFSK